ncbi:lysophospholipid acyltransferase family protein [Polynucleobacter rarus]|jgi:1-acyl-sn-glycerol-3-phosphate acyltransferase|uniref:lysophospholipid acyltransferase family protein n=1 Tax=Polynucleobacter rarus TaxID=556055 RepID=UPI000D3E90D7|nr:lysophospholipid acyltransferase family protein [Polynucleobacter rarus]
MLRLRSGIFFIALVIYTILYSSSCFVVFPFLSLTNRYNYVRGWSAGILWFLKVICNITYDIRGMQNVIINQDKPVILLSKHQSAWETIAYISLFPKQLCYVFKKELLKIPFFGWAMAMLRMIHIDRSQRDKAAIAVAEQGKVRLSEGCWIIIYPEGTRVPVGKQIVYQKGGARLAVNTQANVIPIAHNAGHVWPKNSFLKYPGVVTLSIGPLITTADKNPSLVLKEVEAWIEAEMRVIDPSSY